MIPTLSKKSRKASPSAPKRESVLTQLGVIGMDAIEPVILGALIGGDPLLLIGPHGTGKSYLLNRISAGLGLEWRHYNASLLNYDDLVGFPLPGKNGSLEYVKTPASIWGAEAVFIDEISRCRPDLQNKLFPIIHERRVQGILLDKLVYRWSAMNPPANGDDDEDPGYRGSEPLDVALADRFAFVVPMPEWGAFSESQQVQVILAAEAAVPEEASHRLRILVSSGRSMLATIREEMSPQIAGYVRILATLLLQAGIQLSPRRAGTLLRNILAVHSARIACSAVAEGSESASLALFHSLPHPAAGEKINRVKVLAAHREAWKIARMEDSDPRRIVLLEKDPLLRVLRASQIDTIPHAEFSTIVADSLASLRPGERHALAAGLFENGAAGRLVAAVAEQCAALYALAATPQDIAESVGAGSERYRVWQELVSRLAKLKENDPDVPLTTNLFTGLFAAGQLPHVEDIGRPWRRGPRPGSRSGGFMNRKGKSRTLAAAPAADGTPTAEGQQNNLLHNMSCAPTSRIDHRSRYRRPGSRSIVFALASREDAISALSESLRPEREDAERIDDLHRSLRRLMDTHARTLPFPAAAIVTDTAEPMDEHCTDLLTIATVMAKSSGHVYLRDKVPNLGQITPGRRVILIVPEERRMR